MTRLDVVAAGHALVDIRVVVDRFPGPDEEAEIRRETRGAGGSAVNVSIAASKLGGKSGIIAKIGFDGFGRIVYEELWESHVDLRGLRISPMDRTGFSIVTIDSTGSIAVYGYKGAAERLEPREVDEEVVRRARAVHIASLRLDTSIRIAEAARESGALVSWDPGRRLASKGLGAVERLLRMVDIVFLNEKEARLLTGEEPAKAAEIISSRGPGTVIVKMGARGALLYESGRLSRIKPYTPPAVVDTTGAGDSFAAAALLMLVRGSSVLEALDYASAVAALKVSRLGSHAVPDPREVEEFLSRARAG